MVCCHVGRHKYICQAIVVDVTYGYTTSVVKVSVAKDVEFFCILHRIGKVNACLFGIEQGKQGGRIFGVGPEQDASAMAIMRNKSGLNV